MGLSSLAALVFRRTTFTEIYVLKYTRCNDKYKKEAVLPGVYAALQLPYGSPSRDYCITMD